MAKKNKITGSTITEFKKMINKGEVISAQEARLIPLEKTGDEKALTSIFLSGLKLIREFRKLVFQEIDLKLGKRDKIHVYTEIIFKQEPTKGKYQDQNKNSRTPDGIILIETAGKIKDAVIFEMKNGKDSLVIQQIEDYVEILDKYGISKLITVSNEFVLSPQQSPLSGRGCKLIDKKLDRMRHLSWSYILTLAKILLYDNHINIEDPDQVNIMNEIVKYFEHPKAGIVGFTKMKGGWKTFCERFVKSGGNININIKRTDKDLVETIESWLQEERDMALILSKEIGAFVTTAKKKTKDNLQHRIECEISNLRETKVLQSVLKIPVLRDIGIPSEIYITANPLAKTIEFKVNIDNTSDAATLKGQIGVITKSIIEKIKKNNEELFRQNENKLHLSFIYKGQRKESEPILINKLSSILEDNADRKLKSYSINLLLELHSCFTDGKKIVKALELKLLDFYKLVIENLPQNKKTKLKKPIILK